MKLNQVFSGDGRAISPPVFDGLETLGMSGLEIAKVSGVSPPTISKWRNGHVLVPNEIVVLLTLVLASRLEDVFEKNEVENTVSQTWTLDQRVGLEAARENLEAQEKINHNLPPIIARAGAIRFRYWWNTQERLKTTEMLMNAGHVHQFVTAY